MAARASTCRPCTGRADSGDIEIDLVELLTDVGGLAADVGKGVAIFIDEMQDLGPDDVSALCAACHEISQSGLPVIVVGAGLPHLPAVLSASKSYSERLFRYQRIDRLAPRGRRPRARRRRPRRRSAEFTPEALDAMYAVDRRLPLLHPGLRQGRLGRRAVLARSPPQDIRVAAPEAESELAVGFFGSRFERATPAEREYLRAMADAALMNPSVGQGDSEVEAAPDGDVPAYVRDGVTEREAVPTSAVADVLGRKPQSLSPARDALIKKGLIYSGERGLIAFTVPHFGRYLRTQS